MDKCKDCGWRSVWWRGHGVCRPCLEKAGHASEFIVEIDIDVLFRLCGEDSNKTNQLIAILESLR